MRAELMGAVLTLTLAAPVVAAEQDVAPLDPAEIAFLEYLSLLVETEEEWIDPLTAEELYEELEEDAADTGLRETAE